jgi:hypothetical protein
MKAYVKSNRWDSVMGVRYKEKEEKCEIKEEIRNEIKRIIDCFKVLEIKLNIY